MIDKGLVKRTGRRLRRPTIIAKLLPKVLPIDLKSENDLHHLAGGRG
jgi:hypothetical protein